MRRILTSFLAAGVLSVFAAGCIYIPPTPPPPPPSRVEVMTARPLSHAMWVKGVWRYAGPKRGWVWIPGHWQVNRRGRVVIVR